MDIDSDESSDSDDIMDVFYRQDHFPDHLSNSISRSTTIFSNMNLMNSERNQVK